tara:strand:+ start:156 stop:986 length:831 start_codon:yes stop_codon:yes gene_type:complete
MATLNDILNAPTVNTALSLANAYAMTEYGLMGDAKTQFVNENFPDLVLQSELVKQGVLDNYGNVINDPNYSTLTSMQNPSIAEVPAALQGGYTTPDTFVTETGLLADPEQYQGTILDTLIDSSKAYAESDFGKSVGAVPYTPDYVPVAVQQALEAEANQKATPIFEPISNLTDPMSGVNFMPTNLTGQFFGINPTTNAVELMTRMEQNPVFKSGVAGFTDMLPSGFEFGTPFKFGGVKRYQPKTFDEFVAEKEAEEKAERANDKTQRGTYAGGTIG